MSDDGRGDVSVIVPVYNDPRGIDRTLRSLREQGRNLTEVVVVDNGSTDGTRDRVRALAADDDRIVTLVEDRIQGSYAARNEGIRRARGDVLAFVDADMTVPEGWLDRAVDAFERTDAAYVGCNVELTLPPDPPLAARYDYHTGFPVKQYVERQRFAPTCCLLVRRDVFEDVGLFDHRLRSGGDKEFGNRVHQAGYGMEFADEVTMYHPARDSIRALVSKDLRVGAGLCQLQRYHPDRYGTPGVPPSPSGIKSPDHDLPARDRVAFGTLSKLLTGVRGIGYYREYVAGERRDDLGGIPSLDE